MFCFFFFKQKTAYEMRISDWSSDVCSSDLEHFRGGQSFFVCPRIEFLDTAMAFIRDHVPELKAVVAHGQMAPTDLDDVMNAFYDRRYDVLVATNIVESGLDIPSANTLVVYRADLFGLAQMYQLRGRVGRPKLRAYSYFTYQAGRLLSTSAEQRLRVLQRSEEHTSELQSLMRI